MIFLPKCRALCVDLEKGHGAGKKGMALEKKGIVKVVRGNSKHLGHMTKMAATPIYGKNPSKIFFSRTGRGISTKLGM